MRFAVAFILLVTMAGAAFGQSDGIVTVRVTTATANGQYAPNHIVAIWVTDAQTNFVKTLERQAGTRIRYLYKWGANSQSNIVDGVTGATLTSHRAHNLTWNCRNTSGAIVPDGTYRVFIEFTESNAQGPYTQLMTFVKGSAGVTSAPANFSYFSNIQLTYAPLAGPPVLNAIGDRFTAVSNALQFAVTATATGGDAVTLTASNLPSGATFGATNAAGTFRWTSPAPIGVYTSSFYATDKDGTASETIRIYVTSTGSASFGLAWGSPSIAPDPANAADQNNAGERMDLDVSGGQVSWTSQGGLGGFGQIYVNHDASNLYLGGHAMNVGGQSNAAVLFLDVNTLTNNATNLWAKGGNPRGLDQLHNIQFTPPMDLAILLGDEYGDGQFPSFNLGNGYDFGQGVFLLGATNFTQVASARVAQFDGTEPDPTLAADDDGNRTSERWEVAIPWSALNASGISSISQLRLCGIVASSATNGVDRYISGNYLGQTATSSSALTNSNFGFGFVTMQAWDLNLAAGRDLAISSVGPGVASPGTTSVVWVTVSNRQTRAGACTIVASNRTAAALIGSATIAGLPFRGVTNVAIPWNTSAVPLGLTTVRVTLVTAEIEAYADDNIADTTFLIREPTHDIAVSSLAAPAWISTGASTTLIVTARNNGDYAETIRLSVTNSTLGSAVGSAVVTNLPAYTSTNIPISWSTIGLTSDYHVIVAWVAPVTGESSFIDNRRAAEVAVSPTLTTTLLVSAGGVWRYSDEGLDLAPTVWKIRDYPDLTWKSGAMPIGFGNGGEATALTTTNLTTLYARNAFRVDFAPVSSTIRARFDDGVAIAIDGTDVARANLPTGAVPGSAGATGAVEGSDEATWTSWTVPAALLGRGSHALAVEVHQATNAASSSAAPWINEFHYDNTGIDTNEGVEVAGPAGLVLTNYAIYGYGVGAVYTNRVLSGTIPAQSNGYGVLWFDIATLRNSTNSALVLVRLPTQVVHGLSYEGSVLLTDGPAAGSQFANIPMMENSSTPVGYSLQLGGTGATASAFSWTAAKAHSRGQWNSGQAITSTDARDLTIDIELQGVVPNIPARPRIDVVAMDVGGSAQQGDDVGVSITLTNRGNVTVPATVLLVLTNTGEIVASETIAPALPGSFSTIHLTWPTLGLAGGTYGLRALVVINGVTNLVGGMTTTGTIAGSGVSYETVDALSTFGGFCSAVAVDGATGLLGEGANVVILDLSQPTLPRSTGRVALPGRVEHLAVAGGIAYASAGASGVQVLDVSNPADPRQVARINTPGFASQSRIVGTRLFVADGPAGLRILDISVPSSPVTLGVLATEGPAYAVAVGGSTAYVLDAFRGLLVVNVASPATPAVIGELADTTFGTDLALSGTRAIVVDENGLVSVVNVSAPATPTLVGQTRLPASARAVSANATHAYVAAESAGLFTVQLTPTPIVVATNPSLGEMSDVAAGPGKLFAADGSAGLHVLDTANPAAPVLQHSHAAGWSTRDAVTVNGIVYVASGDDGVLAVSLTNPVRPTVIANLATPPALRLAASGARVIAGHERGGVSVIDAATMPPTIVGSYTSATLHAVHAVAASGTGVALSDGSTMQRINANGSGPWSALASVTSLDWVFDLDWNGSLLLSAEGAAGLVIRDASSLAVLGQLDTAGLAMDVTSTGTTAWVADGVNGWITVNIADPAHPVVLRTDTEPGLARSLAVEAATLRRASDAAVSSTDVSAPLTPVDIERLPALATALRVTASGGHILAAGADAGLVVLAAGDTDTDGDGMPDAWEQAIVDASDSDTLSSIADVLRGDDFDGDGASNYAEYVAGTGPTDANSVFTSLVDRATGPVSVRWTSVAGKTYSVFVSTNLASGFTLRASGIAATAPLNTWTDPNPPAGSAFYVIAVE